MSVQAIGWVLDHSPARGADRLVLIAIANHAGQSPTDGAWEAWPGIELIQREAGLDRRRTVTDAVTRLVEAGLIERIVNGAPDSRVRPDQRPNLYRILLDDGVSCGDTRCRWCSESPRGVASRRHGVSSRDRTGCRDTTPKPSERTVTEPRSGDVGEIPSPSATAGPEGEGSKIVTTAVGWLPGEQQAWFWTSKDEGCRRTLTGELDRLVTLGHAPDDLAVVLSEPMPDGVRSPAAVMLERARTIARRPADHSPGIPTGDPVAIIAARTLAHQLALDADATPDEIITELARTCVEAGTFPAAIEVLAGLNRPDVATAAQAVLDDLQEAARA